jgi:hypothetical protein
MAELKIPFPYDPKIVPDINPGSNGKKKGRLRTSLDKIFSYEIIFALFCSLTERKAQIGISNHSRGGGVTSAY